MVFIIIQQTIDVLHGFGNCCFSMHKRHRLPLMLINYITKTETDIQNVKYFASNHKKKENHTIRRFLYN